MRNVNKLIMNETDTGSHNGPKIDASQLVMSSFQIYFGDATAAGTFKLQASNDLYDTRYLPDDFTPTNWVDIPSSSVAITAGTSAILLLPNMCYRWIRCVYTYTSGGSSTIKVLMNAMSV